MLSLSHPYVALLLLFLTFHQCHPKDLLQLFRPKPDLPNELNDFLTDVQHHKQDFAFIRNVAKNQRRYQNSYLENQHLFGEEIDDQLTVSPERDKLKNDLGNVAQLLPTPSSPFLDSLKQEPNFLKNLNLDLDALTNEKPLKSLFPQPRYSKFIHSPIRLRRELEDNYLNQKVKIDLNAKNGNVERDEPRLPVNKYHTGYVVEDHEDQLSDDDLDDDNNEKNKRQVEINIKSDGKLVKHIEENDGGPKSIILNIKSNNPAAPVATPAPVAIKASSAQLNVPNGNQQSNSKTIPNIAGSNTFGVPINSIPNSNNVYAKNGLDDPVIQDVINKNLNGVEKLTFPEVGRVATFNSAEKKPFNTLGRSDLENSDMRYSAEHGDNNHMAKSIDMAQNNLNSNFGEGSLLRKEAPNIDSKLLNEEKKDDYEKVQGLVLDNTNTINDRTLKEGMIMKREDFNPVMAGFNHAEEPKIILNPGQAYELIEQSTEHVLVIPINVTQCIQDRKEEESEEQQEAEAIGEAIAQEIVDESTTNCGCESSKEDVEEIEVIEEGKGQKGFMERRDVEKRSKIKGRVKVIRRKGKSNHADEDGVLERSKRAKKRRRKHKKKKKKKNGKRFADEQDVDDDLDAEGRVKRFSKKIIVVKKHKGKSNIEEDADEESRSKRGFRKSKKIVIIKKHKEELDEEPSESVESDDKNENADLENDEDAEEESDLDKRAAIKMKKKKKNKNKIKRLKNVHKREDLETDPSLQTPRREVRDTDDNLYDLNEFYDMPAEDDFIPAFRQRQLKSIEAEYDPAIIRDVGDHEKEEIQRFMKQRRLQKIEGYRKKFQDYSEEEDSSVPKAKKKFPIKKTKNQLAFNPGATTEDNDDDYNYSDLSDMEDEKDDDVSYYEEDTSNVEVEEAAQSTNVNKHENDRLTQTTELLSLDQVDLEIKNLVESTTENNLLTNIENILMDAKNMVAGAHAHGQSKAKHFKIRKKTKHARGVSSEEEYDDIIRKIRRARLRLKKMKKVGLRKPHRKLKNPNRKRDSGENLDKIAQHNVDKPLTNQEKQDLFLRFNPEFQRWPRFVQEDSKYQQLMHQRALANQHRHLRNLDNLNTFPISNEYLLNPKLDFVKRQEPPAEEASSEAASEEITATESGSDESAESASTSAETSAAVEEAAGSIANEAAVADIVTEDANQAAQEVLQTVNSDVLGSSQIAPEAAGSTLAAISAEASTKFVFTTIAEDLTEDTNCDLSHSVSICPDDTGSHVPVSITSVLPLMPESATGMKVNITKDEFLDLNEIVGGELPKFIVRDSLSSARGSVRHGLRTSKYNMNLQLSNYNSSAETGMILNEMTNLMMKLKYHTTCQTLPSNLLRYVKMITQNEMDDPMWKLKEMNDIDFDEHQSNYVFRTGQTENIKEKVEILKELLNRYNNLPADCKERAEPVREYIMSHLNMASGMSGGKIDLNGTSTAAAGGQNDTTSSASGSIAASQGSEAATTVAAASEKPKVKKEISGQDLDIDHQDTHMLEDKVMEEGLLNQNADANEVIEDQDKKIKRDVGNLGFPNVHRISTSTSPQYGKLAEAVRTVKNKRAIMQRISQIYGRFKRDEKKHIDEKGFEQPRVIDF